MEINSTLFVQCVHFIIAYILTKRFLLQPAYMVIKNEHDTRQMLTRAIEKRRDIVAHKKDELNVNWQNYINSFSTYTPNTAAQELYMFTYELPSYHALSFDRDFLKKEVVRFEQGIVQAIRHQYE